MSRSSRATPTAQAPKTVRCAIYTRKSSEEGLGQEFNSLDAQREAAEAYIVSQAREGWVCLPERYDDGGYSGGTMDRPALQRLLADIEAGRVDAVLCYKVDRLTRRLMDFSRIIEVFERHGIAFVSISQSFNTAHAVGRLTLNLLMTFSEFEREIIGERIRDKLSAARRKGKWVGGTPILGYDVLRSVGGPKLVVNPDEAARVRAIFDLYLALGSLMPVVEELQRRGWTHKVWTTRAGKARGGKRFDRNSLWYMLTNALYAGQVLYKGTAYAGEHEAIIAPATFERVQAQLREHGRTGGTEARNRYGALLKRLLFCKPCGRAMVHVFNGKGPGRSRRQYRYYTCTKSIKEGRRTCPGKSLPAAEIERAVVDQIRAIGSDPELVAETLRQVRAQTDAGLERLSTERAAVERALTRYREEVRALASQHPMGSETTRRIADLSEQVRLGERRLAALEDEVGGLERGLLTQKDMKAALGEFDGVWKALTPREQADLVRLLVSRVEFDPAESSVEISFHAAGIKALAGQDASLKAMEAA